MEQERLSKGIWIPIEIWKDKNLTWNEKILFLEIDSYTSSDKDCFFSNEYISELLGISVTNASKAISSLIEKGYIIKTKFDGRKRYVKTALSYSTSLTCREQQPSCARDNNITIKEEKKDNNTNNKEKEYKEKFANFVSAYKKMGGKVRSVNTEFNDFTKRHKDWQKVLPYLELAVQRETKARNQAKAQKKFFPEPKMLQTYLGKQRAWELYVTIGEEIKTDEYTPICDGALSWSDYFNCYVYVGMYYGHVSDGYTDKNRPNGAKVMLGNGGGFIMWNSKNKMWYKL